MVGNWKVGNAMRFSQIGGISSDGEEEIFGKCYENGTTKRNSPGKC